MDDEDDLDQIHYANNGFVLSLEMKQYESATTSPKMGDKVFIYYSATVNDDAHAVLEGNKARLEYSNDPTDWTKTGKIDDRVDVYNYDIVVDKFEAGDERQKLSGATFRLVKYATAADTDGVVKETANTSAFYYREDTTNDNDVTRIAWVTSSGSPTSKTTDTDGAATFMGLKPGIYYLEEIAAPTGYKVRESSIKVEVSEAPDGIAALSPAEQHDLLTNVASVPNTPGEDGRADRLLALLRHHRRGPVRGWRRPPSPSFVGARAKGC